MSDLQGRVALVTGASSGIGAGVAEALARAGADVAVNHPDEATRQGAERVVAAIASAAGAGGGRAIAVRADVSRETEVAALVEEVERRLAPISILINNAGIATSAPVHELSAAQWDRVMEVHLRGTFLCTRSVLPGMYARGHGRIISTSSQLAYRGAPSFAHYTAAKAALLGFTRSLVLELGERDITANCVAPGATRTPMLADVPEEILEEIRTQIPQGRLAEVADIVPAYLFLASDEARYVTGQCLSPNGGNAFF